MPVPESWLWWGEASAFGRRGTPEAVRKAVQLVDGRHDYVAALPTPEPLRIGYRTDGGADLYIWHPPEGVFPGWVRLRVACWAAGRWKVTDNQSPLVTREIVVVSPSTVSPDDR